MKLVNLEQDMPTVPLALSRLDDALRTAQREGCAAVKIIHGYGSSGKGGALRLAIQKTLRQMAERGEIRACVFGEDWRVSNESSWELLKARPELKQDRDLGAANRGITVVVF